MVYDIVNIRFLKNKFVFMEGLRMKKILSAILIGVMVLSVMACSSKDNNSTSTDTTGDKGEKKKVVVFTDPNFPPFEYLGESGEVVGVDMEIAKAIATEINADLEIEESKFDAIITALASGKGDFAISGMTITDERKENVDFSDPYITSVQYLIVPDDSSIEKMEDLEGMTVGVALGYTGQFLMEDEIAEGVLTDKGVEIKEYNSAMEGTQDIGNRIDAVVMDEYVAKNIVDNNDSLKAIELKYADGTLAEEEYGVAIPKGNEDLVKSINAAIAKLKAENKVAEWCVQYAEDYKAE